MGGKHLTNAETSNGNLNLKPVKASDLNPKGELKNEKGKEALIMVKPGTTDNGAPDDVVVQFKMSPLTNGNDSNEKIEGHNADGNATSSTGEGKKTEEKGRKLSKYKVTPVEDEEDKSELTGKGKETVEDLKDA